MMLDYQDLAQQNLHDLREDFNNTKIQLKRITLNTN